MKRVVFGYEGGFPLEQQTLMQIQEAYSEDMLEGLFALWGLDPTKKYKIEVPTSNTKDGWLILPLEVQIEGQRDGSGGDKDAVKKTKLQLVRLVYDKGGKRVLIEDVRLNNGELAYADKGIKNKVYEEFVAKLVPTGGVYNIDTDFLLLTNILKLASNINSNTSQINSIREDYLPRNGSKPMTGDLIAEKSISVNGKVSIGVSNPNKSLEVNAGNDSLKIENLADVNSQIPLVIDGQGNVGKNPAGIANDSFVPGMIMMWSGLPSNVPADWILCDGRANVNGIKIPDLRGRFVAGYNATDSDYSMGVKRGVDSYTLREANIPAHSHKLLRVGSAEDSQSTQKARSWEASHDDVKWHDYETTKWGSESPSAIDNRPRYYVLAFIIYVGEFNAVPTAKVEYSDGSILRKSKVVANGETLVVSLNGTKSTDSDGSVATYFWEKCFEREPWTSLGNNITGTLQYTIPANRYGTHYFRLNKVTDNEGANSQSSNVLEYEIQTTSSISVRPTGVVSFEEPGLAGTKNININAKPGWRIKENRGGIRVNPSSSISEGITNVSLTPLGASNQPRIGEVVFETTDGLQEISVFWEQEATSQGGGDIVIEGPRCFDLESDVLMASGRSKKLKNIVVGDELRVYNFVNQLPSGDEEFRLLSDLMKDATVKISKVTDFGTQTVEEYRKITLVNGEILNVTPSHPILASRDEEEVAWLLPDDLRAGYFVVNKEGKLTEIESKRTIRESLEIGVLQLESGDNYFIENIMVHNATILRAVARTASRIEAQPIEEVDIIDKR